MQMSYQYVKCSCYFLLTRPNQHNIIQIDCQCTVLWEGKVIKISVDYVITHTWRVAIPLR